MLSRSMPLPRSCRFYSAALCSALQPIRNRTALQLNWAGDKGDYPHPQSVKCREIKLVPLTSCIVAVMIILCSFVYLVEVEVNIDNYIYSS